MKSESTYKRYKTIGLISAVVLAAAAEIRSDLK